MVMDDTIEHKTDIVDDVLGEENPEDEFEYDENGDKKKKKKRKIGYVDKMGVAFYGNRFSGYQKIEEYRDLIPAFKDFFYERRILDPNVGITQTFRDFNAQIYKELGREMFPYPSQISTWRKKWEKDILEKQGLMVEKITAKKNVRQILRTREVGENGVTQYQAPTHEDLETATQTLAGELVNDALQQLRDDQEMDEIYDSDELMKRKAHVVNVFGHVTKLVHGKAALLLKASQEKRENAGFLMDLMNKARSGKMGVGEIDVLKTPYQVIKEEQNA